MAQYVGVDVHRQTCHATVMDECGNILKQEKFLNREDEFLRVFDGIENAEVAMEATYCWQPAYEWIEQMGHKPKLTHPMKPRIIAEARIKTDVKGSEALAHLLRADLLPTSYVPPKKTRELRALVRLRTYLVRERVRLKNKIHAELAKRGIRFLDSPFTEKGKAWLKKLKIKPRDYEPVGLVRRELIETFEKNRELYELRKVTEGFFGGLETIYGSRTRCKLLSTELSNVLLMVLAHNLRTYARVQHRVVRRF